MPSSLPNVIPSQVSSMAINLPKSCGFHPSFMRMPSVENQAISWNAVLVGILSCVLAIFFLLICIHYFAYRRRCDQNSSDGSLAPVVEKNSAILIPMTVPSARETTSLLKENTKVENGDAGNGHLPDANPENQ